MPAAALSALAADHSCSTTALQDVIVADWVPEAIAAMRRVQRDLAAATDLATRQSINRDSDITLAEIDDRYLTRAMAGHMHFQLARNVTRGDSPPSGESELRGYLHRALESGADANATAAFAFYHATALRLAAGARACFNEVDGGAPVGCRTLLWRAWLAEWLAIHFLEEGFSASHIVGNWGNVAQSKGTHDYYGEHGLDAMTWDRAASYGAQGDGFLRDEDVAMGSRAVSASLVQFARMFHDGPDSPQALGALEGIPDATSFDLCHHSVMPSGLEGLAENDSIVRVLLLQPRPSSLEPSMPRMRMEIGAYFAARLETDWTPFTFGDRPDVASFSSNVTARALVGVGAAIPDLVSYAADADIRLDFGAATRVVDERSLSLQVGLVARLRLPLFAPFDIPYAIVNWIRPRGQNTVQVLQTWGNGGWPWRWQRQHFLGERWFWQLSFGREASVTWFPELHGQTVTMLDLQAPIVEFRHIERTATRMTSEFRAVLGAEARWNHGDFQYVGAYLNIALGARIYFYP